jgi:peptidoglycan/LPS O-acetylase OafA/YrhL
MGTLRFIFAFTVLISHGQPLFGLYFVGPVVAVQSFFIISGFYMSLVLNEKYEGAGSYKVFITNRFLRIFPPYWAICFLMFLACVIFYFVFNEGLMLGLYIDFLEQLRAIPFLYMVFSNLFIFGQDVLMFMKIDPAGGLAFSSDFMKSSQADGLPPTFLFLLVPQAWSLSTELFFYLMAPFLVRRGAVFLLPVIFLSLAVRFYLHGQGFTNDPWSYRFFPSELAFFLSGALSYKIYRGLKKSGLNQYISAPVFISMLLLTLLFQFLPQTGLAGLIVKEWVYYVLLVLAIPVLFLLTNRNRVDNYLGELAYPVYISHLFVFFATTYKLHEGEYAFELYLISIALTMALSVGLIHFLIKPLERIRQGRFKALAAARA